MREAETLLLEGVHDFALFGHVRTNSQTHRCGAVLEARQTLRDVADCGGVDSSLPRHNVPRERRCTYVLLHAHASLVKNAADIDIADVKACVTRMSTY